MSRKIPNLKLAEASQPQWNPALNNDMYMAIPKNYDQID